MINSHGFDVNNSSNSQIRVGQATSLDAAPKSSVFKGREVSSRAAGRPVVIGGKSAIELAKELPDVTHSSPIRTTAPPKGSTKIGDIFIAIFGIKKGTGPKQLTAIDSQYFEQINNINKLNYDGNADECKKARDRLAATIIDYIDQEVDVIKQAYTDLVKTDRASGKTIAESETRYNRLVQSASLGAIANNPQIKASLARFHEARQSGRANDIKNLYEANMKQFQEEVARARGEEKPTPRTAFAKYAAQINYMKERIGVLNQNGSYGREVQAAINEYIRSAPALIFDELRNNLKRSGDILPHIAKNIGNDWIGNVISTLTSITNFYETAKTLSQTVQPADEKMIEKYQQQIDDSAKVRYRSLKPDLKSRPTDANLKENLTDFLSQLKKIPEPRSQTIERLIKAVATDIHGINNNISEANDNLAKIQYRSLKQELKTRPADENLKKDLAFFLFELQKNPIPRSQTIEQLIEAVKKDIQGINANILQIGGEPIDIKDYKPPPPINLSHLY